MSETSPTHPPKPAKAVALKHLPGGAAPVITAVGQGKLAEDILRLAFEHGVKVREDADLTEMLSAFDADSPIPFEAFQAVAEILLYVYRANNEEADLSFLDQLPR